MSKTQSTSSNWDFNLTKIKNNTIPEPYGSDISGGDSQDSKNKRKEVNQMKMARAKDLVIGQGKSIFMTFISSYFIGRNLSLFTIFIYGFTAYNAFSSVLNVNNVFKMLESPEYSLLFHKIAYVCLSLVSVLVIMYKIYQMGLVPLNPADWAGMLHIDIPKRDFINLN